MTLLGRLRGLVMEDGEREREWRTVGGAEGPLDGGAGVWRMAYGVEHVVFMSWLCQDDSQMAVGWTERGWECWRGCTVAWSDGWMAGRWTWMSSRGHTHNGG